MIKGCKVNKICYRCKKKVQRVYLLKIRMIRGKKRKLCSSCCVEICKHTELIYDNAYINLDSQRKAIITMVCEYCGGGIQGVIKVDKMLIESPNGEELDL